MTDEFTLDIQCSNCGATESLQNSLSAIDELTNRWGSFGSALYCPKCCNTWHERNNKPMADKRNTFSVLFAMILREYGRKKDNG